MSARGPPFADECHLTASLPLFVPARRRRFDGMQTRELILKHTGCDQFLYRAAQRVVDEEWTPLPPVDP